VFPIQLVHVGPVLCQAKLRSRVVKSTVELVNEKQLTAIRHLLQINLLTCGAHYLKLPRRM
jgi:hypothetical protein